MKSRITASVTVRTFSEILNRVRYRGESFVVERGGKPICEISPATPVGFTGTDLAGLLRSLPRPDEAYLALVGELANNQARIEKSAWPR